MEEIKVSVFIPVYNAEKYIEHCAQTLFEQTLQEIEFIFVDDCSPDNSISILEEVAKKYPKKNIRIIRHTKNAGPLCARKTAMENAKGKYWICCDSDDWVEHDMYERMLIVAESEQADMVCCGIVKEGTTSIPIRYNKQSETKYDILNPDKFGGIYGIQTNKLINASLYMKHDIKKLEGLSMWEDSCVTIPLRLLSKKTILMRECFYHYNVANAGSICHTLSKKHRMDMISAIKFLNCFFKENNLEKDAFDLLNERTMEAYTHLLGIFSNENKNILKDIFPKANIWKYTKWTFKTKLKIWLIVHMPFPIYKAWHNLKTHRKTQ